MLNKLIIGIMLLALSFAMPATADEKQSAKDEKSLLQKKRNIRRILMYGIGMRRQQEGIH